MLPVTFSDIEAAAERLSGHARLTPLLEDEALNGLVGGRLLLKAEPLQRTGSFKFRGAFNKISCVDEKAVVAYSSGNHAQGVALSAKLLGKDATIIMPADAPHIKQENTKALGAVVRTYDRYSEIREEIGAEIAETTSAALVKPYDDPHVIAGQGTSGLEMAAQAKAMEALPDQAILCTGGGGLTAGCCTALTHLVPGIEIYSCEPDAFDDHKRSLQSGNREGNDPSARSICDALLAEKPGELTFEINRHLLKGGLSVDDDEVRQAMRLAFERLKIVVEPGGAVALAAVLSKKLDCRDKTTLVMLSGGNVDPTMFRSCLGL